MNGLVKFSLSLSLSAGSISEPAHLQLLPFDNNGRFPIAVAHCMALALLQANLKPVTVVKTVIMKQARVTVD